MSFIRRRHLFDARQTSGIRASGGAFVSSRLLDGGKLGNVGKRWVGEGGKRGGGKVGGTWRSMLFPSGPKGASFVCN